MIEDSRLDDLDVVAQVDRRDVLRSLALAGANVRRTRVLAHEAGVERVAGGERPRAVLVAAAGTSAVVGHVLNLLAEVGSPVTVGTRRNVPLPGWVGPLDLVIAISQSGRAAGPLALAAEAGRRGASLLTVGAAGSPLAEVCARFRGVHVDPEGGEAATSRGSLWSLLVPVLLAAAEVGVINPVDDTLEAVADTLDVKAEECRPSSESFVNPAKILALGLGDTMPVVLGDGPLTGVVAERAAAMISRTARIPTTYGELPDAASQVVAAFDGPYAESTGSGDPAVGGIFADPFLDAPAMPRLGLLMLREPLPDPVTEADAERHNLAQAVVDSAQEAGVRVWERVAPDRPAPVRLADQIALVDYTATYLAIGLGLDPAGSAHVTALHDRTGPRSTGR